MKRITKIMAMLLAIVIAFGMGYSVHYISNNTHHECCEEACPICEQLSFAEGLLQKITTAILTLIVVLFVCDLAYVFAAQYHCVLIYQSPIQLKVKLLD